MKSLLRFHFAKIDFTQNLVGTVWKIKNFSATQILCEIIFDKINSSFSISRKISPPDFTWNQVWRRLEFRGFNFCNFRGFEFLLLVWVYFRLQQMQNFITNQSSVPLNITKWQVLDLWKSLKLISRKCQVAGNFWTFHAVLP